MPTINTGTVYNDPGGTVDLTGSAVIKNGWFYNIGQPTFPVPATRCTM